MRQNYKMLLSYDGGRYYGWEHQPGIELTIQGKLESVLSLMTGEPVEVIGAGRTDAGVHAKGMVCNAHMDTQMSPEEIKEYMNHYLPDDICVREVKIAADRFHSRYNALGKTYCYTCYVGDLKPLFNRRYVYAIKEPLDLDRMRQAAAILEGEHDFGSFCGNPKFKKSTVRIVDRIEITQKGSYLNMSFHGTGFLQHMVRILTGTLLEVGMGKREPENMYELLETIDRKKAGPTAPPQGLCMMEVDYE